MNSGYIELIVHLYISLAGGADASEEAEESARTGRADCEVVQWRILWVSAYYFRSLFNVSALSDCLYPIAET